MLNSGACFPCLASRRATIHEHGDSAGCGIGGNGGLLQFYRDARPLGLCLLSTCNMQPGAETPGAWACGSSFCLFGVVANKSVFLRHLNVADTSRLTTRPFCVVRSQQLQLKEPSTSHPQVSDTKPLHRAADTHQLASQCLRANELSRSRHFGPPVLQLQTPRGPPGQTG